jgi:hypothetical protein
MSPLLRHRPSLWITHKENGPSRSFYLFDDEIGLKRDCQEGWERALAGAATHNKTTNRSRATVIVFLHVARCP